jgi:transposase-like protein
MNCDYCGSSDVAKKGFRYNASGKKQKWFCHKCEKWFVVDDGFKRSRIKPEIIVRALHEYADSASLGKVREHLKQHDGIEVSRWAIRQWVVKYSRLLKKTKRDSVLQKLRGFSISMRNT